MSVFSDPKNFPQLKGTVNFEISAAPSFENPKVYALAITVTAIQGPYVEDQFLMFTRPVLIETDSDYSLVVDAVMMMWDLYSKGTAPLSQHKGK